MAASRTCAGVSKSGSPIWRWIIGRPAASSARARALTAKAPSVPIVLILAATPRTDETDIGRPPGYGSSERIAKATFAGRSASRRMYHGYQASP